MGDVFDPWNPQKLGHHEYSNDSTILRFLREKDKVVDLTVSGEWAPGPGLRVVSPGMTFRLVMLYSGALSL